VNFCELPGTVTVVAPGVVVVVVEVLVVVDELVVVVGCVVVAGLLLTEVGVSPPVAAEQAASTIAVRATAVIFSGPAVV